MKGSSEKGALSLLGFSAAADFLFDVVGPYSSRVLFHREAYQCSIYLDCFLHHVVNGMCLQSLRCMCLIEESKDAGHNEFRVGSDSP